MKKIFLSLATVALMMSACTQSIVTPDGNYATVGGDVIVIATAISETRTAMAANANGGLDITWVAGDAIGLFGEDATSTIGTNAEYTATAAGKTSGFAYAGDATAITWGQGTHTFYAYYPYTAEGGDYTAVPASIPAVQTQSAAGNLDHLQPYSFLYAACRANENSNGGNIDLQFQNVFSVLELAVCAEEGSIDCEALIFRSADEGEIVSAEGIKVNLTDGSLDYSAATATSNEIKVVLGEGATLTSDEAQKFYLMITPGHAGKTFQAIAVVAGEEVALGEMAVPESGIPAGVKAALELTIPAPEVEEEELGYELRVLTFEDTDAKFDSYYLEYADGWSGREITTWSELIDSPQYSGPLMYGNDMMDAMYYWYDGGNTELFHMFPDNYAYCYWGGGHAVSNYWGKGYADEDRNTLIAKYYGQDYVNQWAGKPGADAALGWFLLQLTTPCAPHSGDNFCVHYGYKDDYSYIENLPEWSFYDCEPRIIDHMWVTNTNYTLNQLYNGVKSEEGNTFGGDWNGLSEDAWLKIVAQGFESVDDDEPISEAEFYLVNGYNVVEEWQKWDLSGLGKVAKVRFNFRYSEEMGGRYGFTIPGYFAYDDVAVRFDK